MAHTQDPPMVSPLRRRRRGRGGGLAAGNSDCQVMGRASVARAQGLRGSGCVSWNSVLSVSKAQLPKHPVTDPDLGIPGATVAAVSADSMQDHPFLWMTLKMLESGCVQHTLSCQH